MSEKTATTAPAATESTKGRAKGIQVSTSIPADLHAKLDDYRWTARVENMAALTRKALEEYAANHIDKAATK